MNNLPATFDQISNLVPNVLSFAKDFASGLLNVLIAYMVSIYLIASKESAALNTKRLIIALFPPKSARNIFDVSAHAHKVFSNFFIGKLIDSFIIGLLCFIVLMILNYPFALLLSVIVGITNIIPYFGPLIGGGIGFVLLILVSPVQALWFLVIILIIQQFDGNILGPWILGDSVGLSPFWIIFAIIIFGSMFGFIGMFLGAPLLSVIKYVITKQIDGLYNRRTKLALEQVEHHNPID
jgi:predicted PurR-regulated permease PerM